MFDYFVLAVVGVVGITGGLYILHEAKKLKAKRDEHEDVPHRTE